MSTPFEEEQTAKDIDVLHLNPNPDLVGDASYMAVLAEVNQWTAVLWDSMVSKKTPSEDEKERLATGLRAYYDTMRTGSSRDVFFATVELKDLGEKVFGMKDASLWTLSNELNVYATLILELDEAETEARLSR